jgi:signal transduction histidine kinase
MSRWIWSLVVLASTFAAFAVDRRVWPQQVNYELYAVPMVLAALRWPPGAVLVWAIGCLLLAIYDFFLDHDTTSHAAVGFGVLLVVALLALTHAFRHQESQRRICQQQAVIDLVQRLRQPVAVILGYSQLLASRPLSATRHEHAHDAVNRAALDLRAMLDAIMARWGTI